MFKIAGGLLLFRFLILAAPLVWLGIGAFLVYSDRFGSCGLFVGMSLILMVATRVLNLLMRAP